MSESVLNLENVSRTYMLGKRSVQALNNLNLQVKKGEFAAIMGPSGSGKTTLLNVIGCIDKPTKGKVFLDNVDIAGLHESELYKIAQRQNRLRLPRLQPTPILECSRKCGVADGCSWKI